MPFGFTVVELLAAIGAFVALVGDRPMAPAFTLVELVAGLLIGAVIIGVLFIAYDAYRKTSKVTRSKWILAPTAIPCAPASGTLMYRVWQENLKGTFIRNVPGHKVTFTLAPGGASAGSVTIESVTDGVNVVAIGDLTGTGTTDAGGVITVLVQFEQHRSGAITAADAATGQSEASDTVALTAF